jgi:cell division protein ZapA
MADARVIAVEIHGQQYPIRSGLDPVYVAKLAEFVDARMQLAAKETATGDTLKIAVLAALNIADEFFRLRDDQNGRRGDINKRAAELERLLDTTLDSLGLGSSTREPRVAAG